MIVAQHPGGTDLERRRQRLAPQRHERSAPFVGGAQSGIWQIPVNQQFNLDHERVDLVTWQPVLAMRRDLQRLRQSAAMQCDQHIERGLVALLDRRRRIAGHNPFIAEILHDDEPGIGVGVVDDRRRHAAREGRPPPPHRESCSRRGGRWRCTVSSRTGGPSGWGGAFISAGLSSPT